MLAGIFIYLLLNSYMRDVSARDLHKLNFCFECLAKTFLNVFFRNNILMILFCQQFIASNLQDFRKC